MNKQISVNDHPFYDGIVEDRNDPLELGRVRVRVFGVHTESTIELPTSDLAWSVVQLPGNNPAKSGVGWSPNGLVLGSKVRGYFEDGNSFQHFVVTGSLVGINDFEESSSTTSSSTSFGEEPTGETSMYYEIENRNAGTISTIDGVSLYGIYQFNSLEGGLLKDYLSQSTYISDTFAGLTPNSPQFNVAWENLAIKDEKGFKADQHLFIKNNFYLPSLNAHKHVGLHLRGRGVLECVWSTSYQYGAYNNKISRALAGKDIASLTDADVVTLIQDDKFKNVAVDFKGQKDIVLDKLRTRIVSEKSKYLTLCSDTVTPGLEHSPLPPTDIFGEQVIAFLSPIAVKATGVADSKGFRDPSGHYPTKNYKGDVDTNHQARNKNLAGSAADAKKKSVLKGAGEPDSPYNAKYPYNKTYQSESGHVIEIDDTEGAERIHIYHRSGSFVEFHPDGTIVKKSSKDDTEIVLANKSIYVVGTCNIVVEGDAKIKCHESIDMQAKGNIKMMAGGDIKILAAGKMDVGSSTVTTLMAGASLVMDSPSVAQNGGSAGPVKIDVGEKINALIAMAEETHAGTDDHDDDGVSPEQSRNDFKKNTGMDVSTDPTKSATPRDEPLVEKTITISISNGQHQAVIHNGGTTDGMVTGQTISVNGLPKGAKVYGIVNSTTFNVDKNATIDIIEKEAQLGPPVAKQSEVSNVDVTGPYTPDYKLSDHFKIRDLTNTPVSPMKLKAQAGLSIDQIVQNMKAVAQNILEPVYLLLGNKFIISHALRDPAGTTSPSDHHYGSAVDLQFPGVDHNEVVHIAKKIRDILPKWHQIIVEYHGRAPVLHISYRIPGHPRGINKEKTFTAYAKPFSNMAQGILDRNHNLVYT